VDQILLGHPQLTVEVVPGSESSRGRREFIAQRGGPEPGQTVRAGTVDDQLKADRHRFLQGPLGQLPASCQVPGGAEALRSRRSPLTHKVHLPPTLRRTKAQLTATGRPAAAQPQISAE